MREIELHVDLSVAYQHQLLEHGCTLTILPKFTTYDPRWRVVLPEGTNVEWATQYGSITVHTITFPDGFSFTWVYSEQEGKRWYSLNIPLQF